jgi:hypothetical protein
MGAPGNRSAVTCLVHVVDILRELLRTLSARASSMLQSPHVSMMQEFS